MYKKILFVLFIFILINCFSHKDADYYIKKGDYKKAAEVLEIKIKPSYNKTDVKKLLELYNNNLDEFNKAFKLISEYKLKHKDLSGMEKLIAVVYYNYALKNLNNKKDYDSIIVLMDEAIVLDSNYAKPYLLQGKTLVKMSYIDTGRALIKKAIQLNDSLIDGYLYLGNIALLSKEPKKAQDYYFKALAIDTTYYKAWVNLGVLYYKTENYKYALSAFKKAIQFDSLDIVAYDYVINIYKDANMGDSAIYYAELFERHKKEKEALEEMNNDNSDR